MFILTLFSEFILKFWPLYYCLFFEIWYHVAQASTEPWSSCLYFLHAGTVAYANMPSFDLTFKWLPGVCYSSYVGQGQDSQDSHSGARRSQNPAASLIPSSLQGLLLNNLPDLRSHSSSELPLTSGLCLRTKSLHLVCGLAGLLAFIGMAESVITAEEQSLQVEPGHPVTLKTH